jgi:ribosomal protein S12 methylthiotransferase
MSLKVLVHTLGCAKNEFDSSVLAAMLENAGATLVEDVAEADIVVLNTCGFIVPAIEESIETARALREAMKPDARLVIAGCLVNYARDEIQELIPEGDVFLRIEQEDEVVKMVEPGRARPRAGGLCPAFSHYRTAQDGSPSVYLKIAEGCSNGCRYCAIPRIRGRQRSFPREAIIAEAERLARTGAREFVLVAQDLSTYGFERGERDALERLVRELAGRLEAATGDGSFWIRLLYMNPDNVNLARLEALFSIPRVVPYFDIPVQSGSSAVLRRMGRRKSAHEIAELFEGIRARFPESFIRTSLMVGFPGETDDEFAETLDFVERVEPDYCAVFAYSPMPGTPAYEDSPRVRDDDIAWRVRELSELVDSISFARHLAREGSDIEVLIEDLAARSDFAGRIDDGDDAFARGTDPERHHSGSRAAGRPRDSQGAGTRTDRNVATSDPEPHAPDTQPGPSAPALQHDRHAPDTQPGPHAQAVQPDLRAPDSQPGASFSDLPHDPYTADVPHASWVETGRHIGQAPDIDGQVFLLRERDSDARAAGSDHAAKRALKTGHVSGATLAKGAIVRARIVRVEGFDCYAIPLASTSLASTSPASSPLASTPLASTPPASTPPASSPPASTPLAASSKPSAPGGTDAGAESDPRGQPAGPRGSTESAAEPKRSALEPHRTVVGDAGTSACPARDLHPGVPSFENASAPSNRSLRPRETVCRTQSRSAAFSIAPPAGRVIS